jgi:hypothetical protein
MAYRIKGTYVTNCSCRLICPCPFDGKPTGPNDECMGVVVLHVANGNLDDTSLSGVAFAFYNVFPSNFSAGRWKIQLVIDEAASDEQAAAIERIFTGQEGGLFSNFVPFVEEIRPTERVPITFSDGAKPSATIGTKSTMGFEPATAPSGVLTTVKDPPIGFGPEYKLGKGAGSSTGPFGSFEHVYGETAEFELSA